MESVEQVKNTSEQFPSEMFRKKASEKRGSQSRVMRGDPPGTLVHAVGSGFHSRQWEPLEERCRLSHIRGIGRTPFLGLPRSVWSLD